MAEDQKTKHPKVLERMRNNPRGDFSMADVEAVCKSVDGLILLPPTRGSHFKVTGAGLTEILTIPAKRRLKAVYVRKFVSMIDSIITVKGESESEE